MSEVCRWTPAKQKAGRGEVENNNNSWLGIVHNRNSRLVLTLMCNSSQKKKIKEKLKDKDGAMSNEE